MRTAYDIVIRPIITEQSMEDIDIKNKTYNVRDLWEHRVVGTTKERYKAEVPGHGVKLVRLSPANN